MKHARILKTFLLMMLIGCQPQGMIGEPNVKEEVVDERIVLDAGEVRDAQEEHGDDIQNAEADDAGIQCTVRVQYEHVSARASKDACGTVTEVPTWALSARAAFSFTGDLGEVYTMLTYERRENETVAGWMSRSSVGDAYISPHTIQLATGQTALIYETTDHGAGGPHASIFAANFVYYLYPTETSEAFESLILFVQELAIDE